MALTPPYFVKKWRNVCQNFKPTKRKFFFIRPQRDRKNKLAHNCPNEMKAIDAKMATKPALSAADATKVSQLRADGEAQHKAGKHDESMKSLGEAKKMLGI